MACAIAAATTTAMKLNSESGGMFINTSPYMGPILSSMNQFRINKLEAEIDSLTSENTNLRQLVEESNEQTSADITENN